MLGKVIVVVVLCSCSWVFCFMIIWIFMVLLFSGVVVVDIRCIVLGVVWCVWILF